MYVMQRQYLRNDIRNYVMWNTVTYELGFHE